MILRTSAIIVLVYHVTFATARTECSCTCANEQLPPSVGIQLEPRRGRLGNFFRILGDFARKTGSKIGSTFRKFGRVFHSKPSSPISRVFNRHPKSVLRSGGTVTGSKRPGSGPGRLKTQKKVSDTGTDIYVPDMSPMIDVLISNLKSTSPVNQSSDPIIQTHFWSRLRFANLIRIPTILPKPYKILPKNLLQPTIGPGYRTHPSLEPPYGWPRPVRSFHKMLQNAYQRARPGSRSLDSEIPIMNPHHPNQKPKKEFLPSEFSAQIIKLLEEFYYESDDMGGNEFGGVVIGLITKLHEDNPNERYYLAENVKEIITNEIVFYKDHQLQLEKEKIEFLSESRKEEMQKDIETIQAIQNQLTIAFNLIDNYQEEDVVAHSELVPVIPKPFDDGSTSKDSNINKNIKLN